MTIKEIMDRNLNKYVDVEVWLTDPGAWNRFHTDVISTCENWHDDTEVVDWELMDEEDYAHSIMANSCIEADFAEWYGDKDAKVLVILIEKDDPRPGGNYGW